MVNCWFGAWWFGIPGIPVWKGLLLRSNPSQQLTISWINAVGVLLTFYWARVVGPRRWGYSWEPTYSLLGSGAERSAWGRYINGGARLNWKCKKIKKDRIYTCTRVEIVKVIDLDSKSSSASETANEHVARGQLNMFVALRSSQVCAIAVNAWMWRLKIRSNSHMNGGRWLIWLSSMPVVDTQLELIAISAGL